MKMEDGEELIKERTELYISIPFASRIRGKLNYDFITYDGNKIILVCGTTFASGQLIMP